MSATVAVAKGDIIALLDRLSIGDDQVVILELFDATVKPISAPRQQRRTRYRLTPEDKLLLDRYRRTLQLVPLEPNVELCPDLLIAFDEMIAPVGTTYG